MEIKFKGMKVEPPRNVRSESGLLDVRKLRSMEPYCAIGEASRVILENTSLFRVLTEGHRLHHELRSFLAHMNDSANLSKLSNDRYTAGLVNVEVNPNINYDWDVPIKFLVDVWAWQPHLKHVIELPLKERTRDYLRMVMGLDVPSDLVDRCEAFSKGFGTIYSPRLFKITYTNDMVDLARSYIKEFAKYSFYFNTEHGFDPKTLQALRSNSKSRMLKALIDHHEAIIKRLNEVAVDTMSMMIELNDIYRCIVDVLAPVRVAMKLSGE